jgi:hypothetical protein
MLNPLLSADNLTVSRHIKEVQMSGIAEISHSIGHHVFFPRFNLLM